MAREKQTRRMIAMALAAAVTMSSVPVVAFAEDGATSPVPEQPGEGETSSVDETFTIKISTVPGEKTDGTVVVEEEPVIKGDADKSDGNWDYTETTEKTTLSVEAKAGEIVVGPSENPEHETNLDYVSSDAEPDGTNDLIDLLPGDAEVDPLREASGDTGYTLIGADNTSKLVPAVHFGTTPLTDEEKLERWGADAYLKGSHYNYYLQDGLVDATMVQFGEDGKPVTDADGHVLDINGNKLFRQEHSVVGPDGKTYWLRRADRKNANYNVEGWYQDGQWLSELNNANGEKYGTVYALPQMFVLVDNVTGEVISAYCADQVTPTEDGHHYEMVNIEEAGYYDKEQAAMIRAIAQAGYWGVQYDKDSNGEIVYEKDADGNVVYEKDNDGNVVMKEKRDTYGNIVYEKNEDGTFKYLTDENGDVVTEKKYATETDENGNVVYDENGEPKYLLNDKGKLYEVEVPVKIPVMEPVPKAAIPETAPIGSLDAMKARLAAAEWDQADIDSVTDGVALTATQMAIWSQSNKMEGVQFVNAFYAWGQTDVDATEKVHSVTDLLDNVPAEKKDEVKMLFKLYEYFMGLEGISYEEDPTTADTIINAENFLDPEKGLEFTVLDKVESHVVVQEDGTEIDVNKDDRTDNDAYNTKLTFAIVVGAEENNGDDLVVQVLDEKGNILGTGRYAGALKEGEVQLTPDPNTGECSMNIVLMEGQGQSISLEFNGFQNLQQGAYLLEAGVNRDESQTLVTMAGGKRAVNVSQKIEFSFQMDEDKVVVSEKHSTGGRKVPPTPPTDIPDEEPPLTDIPDEEPPLSGTPDEEEGMVLGAEDVAEDDGMVAGAEDELIAATGDNNHAAAGFGGMLAALAGMFMLRKKREN